MAVELTHIGEAIIAGMANDMRCAFLDLCGLTCGVDEMFVADRSRSIAFANVELNGYGGKIFDGTSRVDLVVLIRQNVGVPFELKLGATRLTKNRVDTDWLRKCRSTHKAKRFSGSMIAVLDRKFPAPVPSDPLCVRIGDRKVELTKEWFLIARQQILTKWAGDDRPNFSANAQFIAFEEIVAEFGGQVPFNELVRKLLAFDYHQKWVLPPRTAARPRNSAAKKTRRP
jgi:hypothetical protein